LLLLLPCASLPCEQFLHLPGLNACSSNRPHAAAAPPLAVLGRAAAGDEDEATELAPPPNTAAFAPKVLVVVVALGTAVLIVVAFGAGVGLGAAAAAGAAATGTAAACPACSACGRPHSLHTNFLNACAVKLLHVMAETEGRDGMGWVVWGLTGGRAGR